MPVRKPIVITMLSLSALLCAAGHAQTTPAPPAAGAPGQPALTSYTVSKGELVVAPGLSIPNGNVPWALDMAADGKPVLVPVHAASLNSVGAMDASASRSALRSATPVFFVHGTARAEGEPSRGGGTTAWTIVLLAEGAAVPNIHFTDVGVTCAAPVICLQADPLVAGWQRLAPKAALAPGRYGLLPVKRNGPQVTTVIYGFSVGEDASPRDAVQPGQAIKPVTIKHPAK